MKSSFLGLLFVCAYPVAGAAQQDSAFANFLHLFKTADLPACIGYNDSDLQYMVPNPAEPENRIIIGLKEKDSSSLVNRELAVRFFKTGAIPDTFAAISYHVIGIFVHTSDFYAMVYEMNSFYSGNYFSEKYLCTLDWHGNFIDKLLVASCGFAGTAVYDDGDDDPGTYMRLPWYPVTRSCISEKYIITVANDPGIIGWGKKYRVGPCGEITEVNGNK